jgi:hypothetical protein
MEKELYKAMFIGMFLSKFDKEGLLELGFKNFAEAYNILGLLLNVKPISIRNYRDEFDPVFPNPRKGWHKRPMHQSRKDMLLKYNNLDISEFSKIIKKFVYSDPDIDLLEEDILQINDKENTFAKRLATGQAAEQYFKDIFQSVELFKDCSIQDTTKMGCGFDFKLSCYDKFYAIEVKGLSLNSGSIMLTQKEHQVANNLKENYFIFIVKNFIKEPVHEIFRNPVLDNKLKFNKQEQIVTQISWNAII